MADPIDSAGPTVLFMLFIGATLAAAGEGPARAAGWLCLLVAVLRMTACCVQMGPS